MVFKTALPAAHYDASEPGTVWQDRAGTVPAVADGDPVARIDEARGRADPLLFNTPATLRRDLNGRWFAEMERRG